MVSSSSSPAERLQWTVLAEHRGAFLAPEERETVSHRRIGQLPHRAHSPCTMSSLCKPVWCEGTREDRYLRIIGCLLRYEQV